MAGLTAGGVGWMVVGVISVWCLAFNLVFGASVIDLVDDDKRRLMRYVRACPLPGGRLLLCFFWPLTLWLWFRK